MPLRTAHPASAYSIATVNRARVRILKLECSSAEGGRPEPPSVPKRMAPERPRLRSLAWKHCRDGEVFRPHRTSIIRKRLFGGRRTSGEAREVTDAQHALRSVGEQLEAFRSTRIVRIVDERSCEDVVEARGEVFC